MSDISQIDGQSVRLKRESLGWAISDMATMACLSTKQIRQIEEGGMTAFYSENVKLTAARKVAGLLGLTESQLFGQVTPEIIELPQLQPPTDMAIGESVAAFRGDLSHDSQPAPEAAAISRSESWHFLAQPPENIDQTEATSQPDTQVAALESLAPQETDHSMTEAPVQEQAQEPTPENSNANYLVKILALFLVALAAAALLRQQAGDEKAQVVVPVNDAPLTVAPASEGPATMPSAQESGNAAQASGTGTDATKALPETANEKPAAPPPDQTGKPLPAVTETPAANSGK